MTGEELSALTATAEPNREPGAEGQGRAVSAADGRAGGARADVQVDVDAFGTRRELQLGEGAAPSFRTRPRDE